MILNQELSAMLVEMKPRYKVFLDKHGRIIVKVQRAQYGLIQSGRLWYEKISEMLKANGFVENMMDKCVLNKYIAGEQTTVVLYVDDLLVTSPTQSELNTVKDLIIKEFFDIKIKGGEAFTYLGMNVKETKEGLTLSMKHYIQTILDGYGKELRTCIMPAEKDLYFIQDVEVPLDDNRKSRFHTVVARLLYLSKRTRSDNAVAVNFLCTRVLNPIIDDEKKLERVLGYMKNKIRKSRLIDRSKGTEMYIDAAFSAHPDGKGQSGCVLVFGNTVLEASTRKQTCATRDSTKAEMVAMGRLVLDLEWHEECFKHQGYKLQRPLVYQDNTSTITLVTEGGGKMRNRHMRALQAVLVDGYQNGDYDVSHISIHKMIADLMTKPLGGFKFHNLVQM